MIHYTCDRCEKRIEDTSIEDRVVEYPSVYHPGEYGMIAKIRVRVDLCRDCVDSLHQWVKEFE